MAASYTGNRNAMNEPHGDGERVFPSGHIYKGHFVNGLAHGRGRFTFPDGQVFVGEWWEGKRHGRGHLTMPDGQHVEGEWVNDMLQGAVRKSYVEPPPTPQQVLKYVEPLQTTQSTLQWSSGSRVPSFIKEPAALLPPASPPPASAYEQDVDRLRESHSLIWKLNVELQVRGDRAACGVMRLRC